MLLRFRARSPLGWHPGQHLTLFPGEGSEGIPYSIASADDPQRPGEFELAVSAEASAEMLSRLTLADRVQVSLPSGEFVWRPHARGSLFIGMGTGMAPLRAMLQAARRHPSSNRATLLVGVRALEDVIGYGELAAWAAENKAFRFEPTLSEAASNWSGRRGRVQAHLAEVARQAAGSAVYVCGNRSMVSECVALLTNELGFAGELVFSEAH